MKTVGIQRAIGFAPWEISALINQEVVEQHAENATFLWFMRDHACRAPNYSLKNLADLDERVEANLDGLRVAAARGWEIASQALELEEPGAVFAAGVLAFPSSDPGRIETILQAGCARPELKRALISSLGWGSFDSVEKPLRDLTRSADIQHQHVGIAGYAIHRRDPGNVVQQALSADDARLRARAFRAVGEFGNQHLVPLLNEGLVDPDLPCRFWSTWAAARLGVRKAHVCATLQAIGEGFSPLSERAVPVALLCLDPSMAQAWVERLVDDQAHRRLGVIAAGALGDPVWIERLITLMEDKRTARAAGEAFSRITGVDLAYEDLDGDKPGDSEVGPNDNPAEERVDSDLDEGLPWPAPDLVARWWFKHRHEFHVGVRYLRGKEITRDSLVDCLRHGTQRERAAAALELAVIEPTAPLFEVRAPGKAQIELLSKWTL